MAPMHLPAGLLPNLRLMERCPWQDQSLLFSPPPLGLATPPSILRRTPYQRRRVGGSGASCPDETFALPLATFNPNPPARPIASLKILLPIFQAR